MAHRTVATALCSVPFFKHGARSLEAIVDMCNLRPGYPPGPSDLPTKAQLEMHVDAADFLRHVYKHQ